MVAIKRCGPQSRPGHGNKARRGTKEQRQKEETQRVGQLAKGEEKREEKRVNQNGHVLDDTFCYTTINGQLNSVCTL